MTCHELNDPFLSGVESVAAYHHHHPSAKFPPPAHYHQHPSHHRAPRQSRRALPHLAIDPPEPDVRVSRLSHHSHHHSTHGHAHGHAHPHTHHHHQTPGAHSVQHHQPPPHHQPPHHPHLQTQHHHAQAHHLSHHQHQLPHHQAPHHQASHHQASHHQASHHHHSHHVQYAGSAKPHRRYSEHALTTQPPLTGSGGGLPTPNTPYMNITPIFVATFTKDAFIHVCSDYLDSCTRRYADSVALPTHNEPESVFFSIAKPDIPTVEYVRRLVNYTQCSPSAFVVMLIYLDRIAAANSRLVVTPFNLHRLLLTALTLACKVLDDRCFANAHYAKVGGIRTAREMNRLELQFLHYVDFRLHVTLERYAKMERLLDNPRSPHSPRSIQQASQELAGTSSSLSPVSATPSSSASGSATSSMSASPPHASSHASGSVAVLYSNSPPRPSPRMRSVHDLISTSSVTASVMLSTPSTAAPSIHSSSSGAASSVMRPLSSISSASASFDLNNTPAPTTVDPRHAPPAPGGGKPAQLPYGRTDDFYLHHQHHAAHLQQQPTLAHARPSHSQPLPNVYATQHKRGRRTSASYSSDGLAPPPGPPYGSGSWYTGRT